MVGRERGIHTHWHSGGGGELTLNYKDPARITSENGSLEGTIAPQGRYVSIDHTTEL